MRSTAALFKKNLWAVFLFHQLVIFLSALGFLSLVRNLTGRNIHLGQDPVGLVDGILLVILSAAVIAFTVWLYRWAKRKGAPPLGVALSLRRVIELVIGFLIGAAFAILPWAIALWTGAAAITDRIDAHFDNYSAALIITATFFLLFTQAIMEEVTNRAFPLRLWQHRPLLFRLIVPAVFFAALHLAAEPPGFERFGVLVGVGIMLGLAYLLTGNIWLASGLHAGANWVGFLASGIWHAGAIVRIEGQPALPVWGPLVMWLVVLGLAYWIAGILARKRALSR